ncbi:methylmalonyl-CoA mutase, partial [Salinimicrobium sp. CDJ15-91]|nr:methylmalonyl-CoA mutase [Salinimicrobium oceani]
NDPGMNTLYKQIMDKIDEKAGGHFNSTFHLSKEMSEKIFIIPPSRTRYLSEISENNRSYDVKASAQSEVAQKLYGIYKTIESVSGVKLGLNQYGLDEDGFKNATTSENEDLVSLLKKEFDRVKMDLDPYNWEIITGWDEKVNKYKDPVYSFKVRDKEIRIETHTESLSHTQIPKVALPKYQAWGDILRWCLQENVPGEFPYT